MAITSGLKLNVNKIKSPFGSSSAIPKISAGGGLFGLKPQAGIKPSSILTDPGTLVGQVKGDIANIDRTIAVEKRVSANEKKITILKKILQNQKESGNRELAETNDILKDIGNALALDFASRIQDSKDRLAAQRRSLAAQRRRDKEEGIEGKDKIDKDKSFLSKTFDKVTAPIKGIFGKIFEFFTLLGAGILVKGSFDWLQNPENLDKAKNVFKWLTDNWTWIAGGLAIGGIALAATSLLGAIGGIATILSGITGFLALPGVLPILAIAALGLGAVAIMEHFAAKKAGGKEFLTAFRENQAKLKGVGPKDSYLGDPTDIQMDGTVLVRKYGPAKYWIGPNRPQNVPQSDEYTGEPIYERVPIESDHPEITEGMREIWRIYKAERDRLKAAQALMEKEISTISKSAKGTWLWSDNVHNEEEQILVQEIRNKWNKRILEGDYHSGGTVIGPPGRDKVPVNLTAGEEVITNKDQIASKFRTHLKGINNFGDQLFTSMQNGVEIQSENNKSQKRINDEFRNVLVGFNTQLANVAASRNTGGAMKPTPRSRPNISAVPKQIGGVLVKPRRNRFLDMPLQQAEIDARTVKENTDLQRQEELLVKSRAGRLGSDIEISPYDPSNEYWVAQAYESYGFPGWSDLL